MFLRISVELCIPSTPPMSYHFLLVYHELPHLESKRQINTFFRDIYHTYSCLCSPTLHGFPYMIKANVWLILTQLREGVFYIWVLKYVWMFEQSRPGSGIRVFSKS